MKITEQYESKMLQSFFFKFCQVTHSHTFLIFNFRTLTSLLMSQKISVYEKCLRYSKNFPINLISPNIKHSNTISVPQSYIHLLIDRNKLSKRVRSNLQQKYYNKLCYKALFGRGRCMKYQVEIKLSITQSGKYKLHEIRNIQEVGHCYIGNWILFPLYYFYVENEDER